MNHKKSSYVFIYFKHFVNYHYVTNSFIENHKKSHFYANSKIMAE